MKAKFPSINNIKTYTTMKGTEHFTRTIAEYLNQRAMTDPLFAPNLMKPNKNIEECITYILNYCCPIKPPYTAISSLNPTEIGMISSYFKFQAPH